MANGNADVVLSPQSTVAVVLEKMVEDVSRTYSNPGNQFGNPLQQDDINQKVGLWPSSFTQFNDVAVDQATAEVVRKLVAITEASLEQNTSKIDCHSSQPISPLASRSSQTFRKTTAMQNVQRCDGEVVVLLTQVLKKVCENPPVIAVSRYEYAMRAIREEDQSVRDSGIDPNETAFQQTVSKPTILCDCPSSNRTANSEDFFEQDGESNPSLTGSNVSVPSWQSLVLDSSPCPGASPRHEMDPWLKFVCGSRNQADNYPQRVSSPLSSDDPALLLEENGNRNPSFKCAADPFLSTEVNRNEQPATVVNTASGQIVLRHSGLDDNRTIMTWKPRFFSARQGVNDLFADKYPDCQVFPSDLVPPSPNEEPKTESEDSLPREDHSFERTPNSSQHNHIRDAQNEKPTPNTADNDSQMVPQHVVCEPSLPGLCIEQLVPDFAVGTWNNDARLNRGLVAAVSPKGLLSGEHCPNANKYVTVQCSFSIDRFRPYEEATSPANGASCDNGDTDSYILAMERENCQANSAHSPPDSPPGKSEEVEIEEHGISMLLPTSEERPLTVSDVLSQFRQQHSDQEVPMTTDCNLHQQDCETDMYDCDTTKTCTHAADKSYIGQHTTQSPQPQHSICAAERLERLRPLLTCSRPRRVGLSRRHRVTPLHPRNRPCNAHSN